jgi:hypothetical protein
VTTAFRTGLLLLLALATCACSPTPATLIQYKKDGVIFAHFSDWKVTGDAIIADSNGARSIDLEGPHDAIVMMILMPPSTEMTLDSYAADMGQQRAQTLSVGSFKAAKISAVTSSRATSALIGGAKHPGIQQTFTIDLLGQTVPHEATFFTVADEHARLFIITQVATEDARRVAQGFAATLASFTFKPEKKADRRHD